ncbi:MAG: hypothetical protein JNJ92_11590 [Altererythrobacter sp.]|nr:hypothetical protein [Altererythrobacter sp.]
MAALGNPVALFALAALAATPVGAKEPSAFDAGDYVAPFILICLQNYANPSAQVASAKSMHKQTKKDFWKLESETTTDGTTQLTFRGSSVDVRRGGNNRCAFSADVGTPVTLDTFGAGVSAAFGGVSPTRRVGPPPDIVWILKLQGSQNPLVVTATTSVSGNSNIVTLSVQDF